MKEPRILPVADADAVAFAVDVLRRGQLVVVPTDTVYGLVCYPFDGTAIDRVFAAKGRPPDKALPVLLSDVDAVGQVAADVPSLAFTLMQRFWPGALTLTVPKHRNLPDNLTAYPTIAVRVPNHDGCRALCRAAGGALAATSANRSGGENPTTVHEAADQLGDAVALYLDGGVTPGNLASTVLTIQDDQWAIVRRGPVTEAMITAALKPV